MNRNWGGVCDGVADIVVPALKFDSRGRMRMRIATLTLDAGIGTASAAYCLKTCFEHGEGRKEKTSLGNDLHIG